MDARTVFVFYSVEDMETVPSLITPYLPKI
jgi:hypothetical protein